MNLPKYVYKRLSLMEKWKLFVCKRKAKRAIKYMDTHLKRAYTYEDLVYKTDDELIDYIHMLSVKYAWDPK